MENSTYPHPAVLTLSFGEMAGTKYLYITLVFLCFLMTALSNSAVISVVALHTSLHEPMYIFIAVLCINGLYGSAVFFPSLFVNLISKIHTITYIGCMIQVFGIHTYIGCEMSILAVMALDRYLCICNPLRYNSIMSLSSVFKLIVVAWLYAITLIAIHIILTIRLPLCSSVLQKFYCDNWSVVKLSCVDTTLNNIFGLFVTTAVIAFLPGLILISYLQILRVCMRSSKDFRAKALQTCSPHLITLNYYAADIILELLLNRFPFDILPYELRIFISVQGFISAPLLNPIIYGMKLREIRVKTIQMFCAPINAAGQKHI